MGGFVTVEVVSAVQAQEVAEVGCHLVGHDGTLLILGDGSTIVIEG